MKVFLLNPLADIQGRHAHFHRDWCGGELPTSVVYPPLDLATTAALLRKNGVETTLLDANAFHIKHRTAMNLIRSENPDFIGIPSAWGSLENDLALAALLKQALPEAKIVFSGPNVTVRPERVLLTQLVDYVILGELELPLLNLVKGDFTHNLAFLKDHRVIIMERELLMDLDEMPFAARELLPNKKYQAAFVRRNPFTLMMTSRGCPYSCSFCQAQIWYLNKIRFRSTKNVVDEIEQIVEVFHIPQIIFRDLTLTVKREHTISICEEILKRDLEISWRCFSCVDTVDTELLKIMKRAGCHQISYGIESGSQKVLDSTGKGITLEQSRRAVKLTKEAGIETCCDFMFGMYDDDSSTIKETIDFALKLNPDFAQFQIAIPIYSTQFYNQCYGDRDIGPNLFSARWYKSNFVNPQFSSAFLQARLKTAYRKFYLRLPLIYRQIARTLKYRNFVIALKMGLDFLKELDK